MMQKRTLLLVFLGVSLAVAIIAGLYTFFEKEGAKEFPETKRAEDLSRQSRLPQELSDEIPAIELPRVETTTEPNRVITVISYDDMLRIIEEIIALAVVGGTDEEVGKLIAKIVLFGDAAVPELQRLLKDAHDPNTLFSVARILAEIGTSGATEALMSGIINEPNSETRAVLAASLQYLRNPEAAPILTETLLAQTDDRMVARAVRDSLARVADDNAVENMVIAYHEKTESGLQESYLLGALSRVRNPQTVPALRSILMNDPDSAFRLQAAISLSVIGNREAIDSLVTAIQESQSISSTNVLVQCLGGVRNEGSSSYLLDLLQKSTDESVRYGAALAMANMELDQNLFISLETISDSETSDRVRQVIEALLEKLNDFNSQEDQ